MGTWKAKVLLILTAFLLFHRFFMPNILGYYDKDCQISVAEYNAFKLLFKRTTSAFDRLNQTYWIDFGLLLGYYRHKDMLPHDGDLDLSRVHGRYGEPLFDKRFQKIMRAHNETLGNAVVVEMNYTYTKHQEDKLYVQADIFRYEVNYTANTISPYWNKNHKRAARYANTMF